MPKHSDMVKHSKKLIITALFMGWLVDWLFYGKPVGVSLLVFVLVAVGVVVWNGRMQNLQHHATQPVADCAAYLLCGDGFFTSQSIVDDAECIGVDLTAHLSRVLLHGGARVWCGIGWFVAGAAACWWQQLENGRSAGRRTRRFTNDTHARTQTAISRSFVVGCWHRLCCWCLQFCSLLPMWCLLITWRDVLEFGIYSQFT
jgi:hypothetical protein